MLRNFTRNFWAFILWFRKIPWERVGPLQDRKTQQPSKIGQKHIKNTQKIGFRVFLVYFCPILLVGAFSYSLGGQLFPKKSRKIPAKFPSQKSKKSPRSFCRSAGRRLWRLHPRSVFLHRRSVFCSLVPVFGTIVENDSQISFAFHSRISRLRRRRILFWN